MQLLSKAIEVVKKHFENFRPILICYLELKKKMEFFKNSRSCSVIAKSVKVTWSEEQLKLSTLLLSKAIEVPKHHFKNVKSVLIYYLELIIKKRSFSKTLEAVR